MKVTAKDLAVSATVLAGREGLDREIVSSQMVEPELSSMASGTGIASRIIHIRPSQLTYLCSLPRKERMAVSRAIVKQRPACILVSGSATCNEILDAAEASMIPVLKSRNLPKLTRLLVEKHNEVTSLHGVLVQIFGLGTLIIGESAVGKSEAALDLVLRGHKLAADDMVLLEKTDEGIIGKPTDLGAALLQIRGLGIIDIRALYGESATVPVCKIGLVVEMEEWRKGQQYSLVGLRERRYRLLGLNLPFLKLPVKPGRNMATLIEVAARNQMLKKRGIFTARELNTKLRKKLAR